jgi:hypothetical protein
LVLRRLAETLGLHRREAPAVAVEGGILPGLRPPPLHGDVDIGGLISIANTRRPLASPAMICEPEPENGS